MFGSMGAGSCCSLSRKNKNVLTSVFLLAFALAAVRFQSQTVGKIGNSHDNTDTILPKQQQKKVATVETTGIIDRKVPESTLTKKTTPANNRKNAKTTLHPTRIRIHNSNNIDPNKPYMVIHVGPPKTGTTTLQGAFSKMSANGVFATDGYVYANDVVKKNNPFIWDAMVGKCHGMGGKCQRQLLDLRKAHQLEPTNNNNNNNKPTSSISGGEDKYNISLSDLTEVLRAVPCWNRTLQELEPFVENKTNLLASCESWAFSHYQVWTERGHSMSDWITLKLTLMQDWNILVVFAYRRYPEWLISSFQQINRYNPHKPALQKWNGKKVKPIYDNDMLPSSRNELKPLVCRYTTELIVEMENNPEIPYAIFNMHSPSHQEEQKHVSGLISSFVCSGFLPNAQRSCQYSLKEEHRQQTEMVQNPSQSLFYDALAMSASEAGLIDRDHYKRPAVTKQVKEYHMKALLNTSSSLSSPPSSFLDAFVLKCPSSTQLEGFLNLSLSLEAEIFPELVATNPSSSRSNNNSNISKEHQENFWKQASKHKFCWIDGTATLQMVEWKEFFQKFSAVNKLGMELERKKENIE